MNAIHGKRVTINERDVTLAHYYYGKYLIYGRDFKKRTPR
jgi:histone H3/H4